MDDWVYVKLRPYRQTSVTPSFSKLTKRCYSPLWVEECIGQVAYRLKLPESSKIHLVVHVSLLKPYHGPLLDSPFNLPPASFDNHLVIKPLSLLDWKLDSSASIPTKLVLVQWTKLDLEDTTWKNWDSLRDSYNLGDKVVLPVRGDDSNIPMTTNRPKRITKRAAHYHDFV